MTPNFAKPKLLVSRCLGFEACRYDGQMVTDTFVEQLTDFVDFKTICPEADIGLGTPRPVIRLVEEDKQTRLIQPSSDEDLTDTMTEYATKVTDRNIDADGLLLKSGSPSCGLTAKVYAKRGKSQCLRREPGMFASVAIDRWGDTIAIEDEGRLYHATIRHNFLVRIFAFANLRALGVDPTSFEIEKFHRSYKHLLLLFDQDGLRKLGRIVAADMKPNDKFETYAVEFRHALLKTPKRTAHRNVLAHLMGHFKNQISPGEKASFMNLLTDVDEHRAPLMAPVAILASWVERFDYDYLRGQTYFEPYPKELIIMRDSGKGLEF